MNERHKQQEQKKRTVWVCTLHESLILTDISILSLLKNKAKKCANVERILSFPDSSAMINLSLSTLLKKNNLIITV